jgi:hypothetical protein
MTKPNDIKQVEKKKKRGFYKTKLREEFENRWKKIRLDIFTKETGILLDTQILEIRLV